MLEQNVQIPEKLTLKERWYHEPSASLIDVTPPVDPNTSFIYIFPDKVGKGSLMIVNILTLVTYASLDLQCMSE